LREMPHPLYFINTLTHSLTVTNSHTISLTHPLSLSHSHTHTLTHTLSYTHTHTRTHTLLDEMTPSFYSMNIVRTKKSMGEGGRGGWRVLLAGSVCGVFANIKNKKMMYVCVCVRAACVCVRLHATGVRDVLIHMSRTFHMFVLNFLYITIVSSRGRNACRFDTYITNFSCMSRTSKYVTNFSSMSRTSHICVTDFSYTSRTSHTSVADFSHVCLTNPRMAGARVVFPKMKNFITDGVFCNSISKVCVYVCVCVRVWVILACRCRDTNSSRTVILYVSHTHVHTYRILIAGPPFCLRGVCVHVCVIHQDH